MIVVKGSEVVLRPKGKEGDLDDVGLKFPIAFVCAHDPTGEFLRPCDFYIAKFLPETIPVHDAYEDSESYTAAERYFGGATRILKGSLELPDGAWQRVGLFDEIGYRRRGDRKGLYQHNYAESVPLYECKGRVRAWRIRLPVDCITDERGFVRP